MHFQHQSVESFSDMVVDICDYIKPQLNIVDAVMAMEGEGPGSGDPREVDALCGIPKRLCGGRGIGGAGGLCHRRTAHAAPGPGTGIVLGPG